MFNCRQSSFAVNIDAHMLLKKIDFDTNKKNYFKKDRTSKINDF